MEDLNLENQAKIIENLNEIELKYYAGDTYFIRLTTDEGTFVKTVALVKE